MNWKTIGLIKNFSKVIMNRQYFDNMPIKKYMCLFISGEDNDM